MTLSVNNPGEVDFIANAQGKAYAPFSLHSRGNRLLLKDSPYFYGALNLARLCEWQLSENFTVVMDYE